MQRVIHMLQYVNMIDGRTHFHYYEFTSMEELSDFIHVNYDSKWTSYEIIVVKRDE